MYSHWCRLTLIEWKEKKSSSKPAAVLVYGQIVVNNVRISAL
jgi:hypothetical protein